MFEHKERHKHPVDQGSIEPVRIIEHTTELVIQAGQAYEENSSGSKIDGRASSRLCDFNSF